MAPSYELVTQLWIGEHAVHRKAKVRMFEGRDYAMSKIKSSTR